jgi:hypothetical protein
MTSPQVHRITHAEGKSRLSEYSFSTNFHFKRTNFFQIWPLNCKSIQM